MARAKKTSVKLWSLCRGRKNGPLFFSYFYLMDKAEHHVPIAGVCLAHPPPYTPNYMTPVS
jgi:hypothetical protein